MKDNVMVGISNTRKCFNGMYMAWDVGKKKIQGI
jgi:hypothetical protein